MTSYVAENTVADALSWVSTALAGQGWQRFTSFDPPTPETDVHRGLKFRKQGYALTIYGGIHPAQKKAYFQYSGVPQSPV